MDTKKFIPDKNEVVVSVKGINKSFGDNHILKGIDLDVKTGELVSIIGRSGCGKTTLLRCLNCLEIFDSGLMRIAGITLNKLHNKSADKGNRMQSRSGRFFKGFKAVQNTDEDFQKKVRTLRVRVGMVFQSFNLFPHLTVIDNLIKAPTVVKKESKEEARSRAVKLLEKVGMGEFVDRYPHELSGGQAQRVAIARALSMNPQVMLYDEPTSALDPELEQEVMQVMENLNKEGMTQIVVTHAMHFARGTSDKVVYLEDGKIIETGHPDVLFKDPKDPRTRAFLKTILHD